jgi:hypothetical protein
MPAKRKSAQKSNGRARQRPSVATHPYRIEVTDLDSKRQVLLTVVDWDDTDRRAAIAQIMRWVGVPEDNCFLDEIAPEQEPRKT